MRFASISIAAILVAIVTNELTAQNLKEPLVKNIPIDFARLVESLKNNNSKPRIVGGSEVRFADNYDFTEQRRIYKAIRTLQEYAEEAWPHLVRNLDNTEYSITFGFSDASRNYTVGQVCEQILRNCLYEFHDRCTDLVEGTNVKMAELKDPDLREEKQFRTWLADRSGKNLLDLQIELSENLKKRIPTLDLPKERKARFVEQIDEHLRYVRRRGYAETGNRFIPNRETWWYFSREDANK